MIDDLTKKIFASLPLDAQHVEEDIKQKIKLIIQASLAKLDLVSREEFDVQTQVLAKTREKIEIMEHQLKELYQQKPRS